jgi:type II secretion system protein G
MTLFNYSKYTKFGFTLIELLVVISIIGIMASVVLANLQDVRKQARDTSRLSDMRQIRIALEQFYNQNGRYPDFTNDGVDVLGQKIGDGLNIDNALLPYINPVPQDPLFHIDPTLYFYSYDSQHMIDMDCTPPHAAVGLVFGFNKSESDGDFPKDTCMGTNMNLDDADFNQGIIRGSF